MIEGKRLRFEFDPANAPQAHKNSTQQRRTLAYVFLEDTPCSALRLSSRATAFLTPVFRLHGWRSLDTLSVGLTLNSFRSWPKNFLDKLCQTAAKSAHENSRFAGYLCFSERPFCRCAAARETLAAVQQKLLEERTVMSAFW